tara:strand:+ start:317 stop:580 length:264 start_codon:yes stop_codon:yes gene_type:complete
MLSGKIKSLLLKELDIEEIDIIDESDKHQNHAQSNGGHFKLFIISKDFDGKTLIQRHRLVYDVLSSMIKKEIHALSINARTPSEMIN